MQACFALLPQSDHLGLLQKAGLLADLGGCGQTMLFKSMPGVVIDDFFSFPSPLRMLHVTFWRSLSKVKTFEVGKAGFAKSDGKDIRGADHAKIIGSEVHPESARALGLITLAFPAQKRIALSHLSLELAKLSHTIDALHACLLGGWVRSLLYRSP